MTRHLRTCSAVLDRQGLHDLILRSDRCLRARSEGRAERARPARSHLERLLTLAQTMNRIQDRRKLLTYIRDSLRDLFDAENSEVILVCPGGSLQVLGEAANAPRRTISETLIRRVVRERVPVLVNDASQDPELHDKKSVLELGLLSILCAPLIVEDRVIGVIEFDHRNEPRRFSREDLALLALFANQAATALSNVLLGEQREEAQRKMREAQSQLVATERLRALGQMAAGVAHDFNNLLAAILGLSELLLLRPNTPADLRPTLERLHGCALGGADTVKRIQRFAGGSAGDDELEPVDLRAIVREVAESCADRFEATSERPAHHLAYELGDLPTVRGRASDLRDVVRNLVLNALDAMPEGGPVTIRTLERGGRAVLEVEDAGCGIPSDIRSKIFEPFFTTKVGRGHGLGLSICWGMIRRLGGAIEVRPGPERGTVFALDLPGIDGARPPSLCPAPAEAVCRAPARRVLLVEDDPTVREVLECLLLAAEHEVVTASSGSEALDRLGRDSVDVVITDHGMPGMSGVELATAIRRGPKFVPVILLTGLCPDRIEAPAREVVDLVLGKPVTGGDLVDALERVLGEPENPGSP